MTLVERAPNLVQRLSRLPTAPQSRSSAPQKAQTVYLASCHTTFGEKIYIRWCCIDLLRPPPLSWRLRIGFASSCNNPAWALKLASEAIWGYNPPSFHASLRDSDEADRPRSHPNLARA